MRHTCPHLGAEFGVSVVCVECVGCLELKCARGVCVVWVGCGVWNVCCLGGVGGSGGCDVLGAWCVLCGCVGGVVYVRVWGVWGVWGVWVCGVCGVCGVLFHVGLGV